MHRSLLSPTFDNCGVIVMDNLGSPYVFELSSRGYICTPYAQRILRSTSNHIALISIERNISPQEEISFRQQSYTYAQDHVKERRPLHELKDLMLSTITILCDKSNITNPLAQAPFSPSVQCVLDLMGHCGIPFRSVDTTTTRSTCDDFITYRLVPTNPRYRVNGDIVVRGL